MEIHILRHAVAVERGQGIADDERPLSKIGRQKMEQAARGIRRAVDGFDAILTSPLPRARETAEIVARAFAGQAVETEPTLAPGAGPQEILRALARHRKASRVLLVGHEPDLSRLAAALLGCPDACVEFKKGAVCRIDVESVPPSGAGRLVHHLPPRVLRALGA